MWEESTIGELAADIQMGHRSMAGWRPSHSDSAVLYISQNNVSSDGRLLLRSCKSVEVDDTTMATYSLAPGDVLVNSINSPELVGKTGVVPKDEKQPLLFASGMTRIRFRDKIINPFFAAKFLHWASKTGRFHLLTDKRTTRVVINKNQLESVTIPVPPLSEQRRIVELLERAEKLQQLREEADLKVKQLLMGLFIKTFGNPLTNPMGWATDPLGSVGKLERGRSNHRPRNHGSLFGGPYPLIETSEVANSSGRIRTFTRTYSELGLTQSKMWPAGTLCITVAGHVAKTGVLEFDACFPDSVVGFSPNERVTTDFVQGWLKILQPTLEARASVRSVAQKNISLKELRSLRLPVPPRELQDKFSERVAFLYQSEAQTNLNGNKLDELSDTLLRRAFSGELTKKWREG